ncbi:hypothetical protein [Nocardiopsis sp. CA-288880]|uniref:hypothetical protein n=1 Tax=Nocardiopsis sp. CA-288880 TaxID=3239995 RepID=UPI003D967A29
MSAWSELLSESLGAPAGAAPAVERLSVRPGEVAARVRAGGGRGSVHEVSLIRPVPPEPERERVCAALASQPVFRARILAEELPVAADRVFALLGWNLVPRSWDALVATCSCEVWESRCAHLGAVAAALGAEADRDPFVLTRWLGLDRRTLVARVRTLSPSAAQGPAAQEEAVSGGAEAPQGVRGGAGQPSPPAPPDAAATSAAVFWSAPAIPAPPTPPGGTGERVRASAPGLVADELPGFGRPGA